MASPSWGRKLWQGALATACGRNGTARRFSSASPVGSRCTSIILRRYGPPDRLEVDHSDRVPAPQAGEVLVRVKAAAVNPLDVRMRQGYGRSVFAPLLPLILGRDVSGEVVAFGASAQNRFREGEEVFGALHPTALRGSYSEYTILEENQLAAKPSTLTHEEAASIPFAALTAWRGLHSTAKIKEGQRVLIMGGGGSVGLLAIQLATAEGCQVYTTCGHSSMDKVKEVGAVKAVHYASPELKEELGERSFDAVLDTVGIPQTEAAGVDLVAPEGTYMTLQGEWVDYADRDGLIMGGLRAAAKLAQKQTEYRQSHGINYSWTVMRADSEGLERIASLARDGRLKLPVGKVLPLESAAEAHDLYERRHCKGKIVLKVQDSPSS
eukprot:TRINITY_DN35787_c0_g1_i1.p1 TRINITY_DN35787_c0_g1~~TRINITY_DN35787_c0_g1_i1.p1  ORF type:complete len:381 (+),score=81.25 TRINITY_DN35787_c0_g1_i1:373-1515(+)